MKEVGVRELKNRLSEYLRRVKAGEDVVVTEHGRPLAKLSPLPARPAWLEGMLGRGEATGGRGGAIVGTRLRLRGKGPTAAEILRSARGRY